MAQGQLVAILRDVAPADAVAIVQVLLDGGFHAVEVSLSNESLGLATLNRLAQTFGPKLSLGAGTVTHPEQISLCRTLGATFILTPGWNRRVVMAAQTHAMPIWAGVYSPGEIAQGVELGIKTFKLFPINAVPDAFIKALSGPFPDIELMAVGGVNASNLAKYRKLGIKRFGIGSELIHRGATVQDLETIRSRVAMYQPIEEDVDDRKEQ